MKLYSVYLPRSPGAAGVDGGARLRTGNTDAFIEPYGVIGFAEDSRNAFTVEPNSGMSEVRNLNSSCILLLFLLILLFL